MDALVDAKEILNHLNHLGYRNITAAQLKEFQKDLKKLMLFDARQCNVTYDEEGKDTAKPSNVFDRLHTERTASYQAKISKPSKHTERVAPLDKENNPPSQKSATCKETSTANKMWIRPRSSHSVKRSDPVELYHSYKKDWDKFKQALPGENDHSELRWKIRHKLLGE